jgi:hypothetical protein
MAERAEEIVAGNEESATPVTTDRHERVLALEIRPQRIGFVVFENTATDTRLIDYGVRGLGAFRDYFELIVAKRISDTLALNVPTFVIARQRISGRRIVKRIYRLVIKIVRRETRRRSIAMRLVSSGAVKRLFLQYGCGTRNQIANKLSERFPELSWKLPPKRKPWNSERPRMIIFDAVATGVTFLQKENNRT